MNELTKLAEKRNAILFAEIGAWLHLLWKYDWQFITQHCLDATKTGWGAKKFLKDLAEKHAGSRLHELLLTDTYAPLLQQLGGAGTATRFADFLLHCQESEPARAGELNWLVTLLVESHGRSSGVDKPLHIYCNQQSVHHVALTTAFGYEERILCEGDYRPDELIAELNVVLSDAGSEPRKALPRIRAALREHLSKVPAETRQPGNDITVYDQTAMAVAFFKAALARCVAEDNFAVFKDKQPVHGWRTLAVRVNALEWLSASSKVADLLGRQRMIEDAWNAVAQIVEDVYPLGVEVYRDEAQIAFLVSDRDVMEWSNDKPLRDLLRAAVEEKTHGDLSPDPTLTPVAGSGRWLFNFGSQIADRLPANSSNVDKIESAWAVGAGRERCSNCGLRPFGQSEKASKRQLCDTCLRARVSRSQTWWEMDRQRTVWLEETEDINGRVALITGAFDLAEWLNGTALTGIPAVHAISDPEGAPCRPVSFSEIERDAATGGTAGICYPLVWGKAEGFKAYVATLQDEWAAYFDPENPPDKSTLFAIAAANQRPSFARVRRVWESASRFWDSLLPADGSGPLLDAVGRSGYERLRIVPHQKPDNTGPWHACVLRNNDVEIAAVWIPDNDGGSFVTADNLDYLKRQHGPECLNFAEGRLIEVEEPSGYGRRTTTAERATVRRTQRESDFHPVIRLVADPATFMAIVPARTAWKAASAIHDEYERQMNKVRNRLPLHLGVVFAHRYTPLRAILGAGRRMLQYRRPDEDWTVAGDSTLTRKGQTATWKVECSDQHFPYAYLAGAPSHGTPVSHRAFREQKVCDMARVSDLATGDRIWFTPSTLDFEWLESSGVRFTLSYHEGFRRGTPSRPWLLDDLPRTGALWDRLINNETGLENRQIRGLAAVIEQRREEWQPLPGDPVFAAFCRSALAEADWGKPLTLAELDDFTAQAVSGMLNDVIDLHTRVLKEK